jgi:hypothetical protein
MKQLVKLVIILSAVLIGGCATVVDEPDQNIAIMSTPAEATFVISNQWGEEVHRGMTPSIVNLAKSSGYFEGNNYTIEISKAGYVPERVRIASDPSLTYYVGNIATFLVGWFIVDPLTGAMWELNPNMLDIALRSEQATAAPGSPPAPAPGPPPASALESPPAPAPGSPPALAPEPVLERSAPASFGALVASFENQDQAELGKTEIWSRHPELLGNVQPSITYGSVAEAEPRYLVIGSGLTNDEALSVCAGLEQRNEQCTVIQFQS